MKQKRILCLVGFSFPVFSNSLYSCDFWVVSVKLGEKERNDISKDKFSSVDVLTLLMLRALARGRVTQGVVRNIFAMKVSPPV